MISKPLFKQSYKANRLMWLIITLAVCFMLCVVMLIAGSGNIEKTKVAVQDAMVESELNSQTKKRAINYYELANGGLYYFDESFKTAFATAAASQEYADIYASQGEEAANVYAYTTAYTSSVQALGIYVTAIITSQGYTVDSQEGQEIAGVVFFTLNVNPKGTTPEDMTFDAKYQALGESAPSYDMTTVNSEGRASYRSDYVFTNVTVFLSGNMVDSENVDKVLVMLADYGITYEKYVEFGYTDYLNVRKITRDVLVSYIANYNYRIEHIAEGENPDRIKAELLSSFSGSLLAKLPEDVSKALQDIGSMDLYGLLVGSVFFKMAGLLLPIIYMIMVANALIAGQVDSGSMAYVLSTSTKRKTVIATQALFLVGSLFLMFTLTTITSIICFLLVDVNTKLSIGRLMIINLGAFLTMFAMSGISFLASATFNRSKRSMAIGGGINMFFLVATMLGLFGSPVIPSVVRMDALNAFNYVSIISLFDVVSILNGSLTFLWKFGILILIGVTCYVLAKNKFEKKDLPL